MSDEDEEQDNMAGVIADAMLGIILLLGALHMML